VPEGYVEINPEDAEKLGVKDEEFTQVSSRRGEVKIKAKVTDRVDVGTVFIPFHFKETAANYLTIDALDPVAKIPEFKVCAVKVNKVEE
jgi:formate dehydrogenase major subunit